MNRRLKIIFTVSILLNVLLVGALAGSCYKRWDGPPGFAEKHNSSFNPKMAKAMRDARQGQEKLYTQMKSAKKELADVLAAPSFDEAAFQAASERVNQAQQALFNVRNDATLKMAKEMSVEERQEMAAHMKAMSERHGKFRDHKGDKPIKSEH